MRARFVFSLLLAIWIVIATDLFSMILYPDWMYFAVFLANLFLFLPWMFLASYYGMFNVGYEQLICFKNVDICRFTKSKQ